jgi:homoserine O-acetyltransferase
MKPIKLLTWAMWSVAFPLTALPGLADYLPPKEGSWVVRNFNQRLSVPFRGDANDHLYQWEASRDYNASFGLERIRAALLAINSADDERNPPELGLLDHEIKRVKNGRVLLIPASDQTADHGTTAQARFWKQNLAELLQSAPRRGK